MSMPEEDGRAGGRALVPLPAGWTPFTRDWLETSIPRRFAAMVQRRPGAVAVTSPHAALTYEELAAAAERLAHSIHDAAHSPARTVIVLCEQRPTLVVAILGVLMAGRA